MRKAVAQGGFSLVELIVTIAIFAVAAAGIFGSMSFALAHQSDSIIRTKEEALARSYFEQISARKYDELTPEGGVPKCNPCSSDSAFDDGEARANFDDVDDFDALDESPPRSDDGSVMADFPGYRVQVDVRYLAAAEQTLFGFTSSEDAKVVEISVQAPGARARTFTAVRANF